jgi:hypothetical protein
VSRRELTAQRAWVGYLLQSILTRALDSPVAAFGIYGAYGSLREAEVTTALASGAGHYGI